MEVACCQFDIAWEDKPANYRLVAEMVRSAELEPGSLLLLPEMFATGFSMNAEAIEEQPDGPTAQFLAGLATENQVYVLGGAVLAEGSPEGPACNAALAFDPSGKQVCRYNKMHLFSYAGEEDHYSLGTEVRSFDWSACRVMPAICYDLRFPEIFRHGVFGSGSERGADLLAVIANWPAAREAHWLALLKARAIENQGYVAAVNRVGRDGNGHDYSGRSQIIDPKGDVLADARGDRTVIRAAVDLDAQLQYRRAFPALNDMKMKWFR